MELGRSPGLIEEHIFIHSGSEFSVTHNNNAELNCCCWCGECGKKEGEPFFTLNCLFTNKGRIQSLRVN